MLGNFAYSNPTKLYFGEDSLQCLSEELPKYGKTVQLIYGGGSIKKNGIYEQVMELLEANGKVVVEDWRRDAESYGREAGGGCTDCQGQSGGPAAGGGRRLLL